MLRNFKLIIEYNGTDYHGWQRQKNEKTIQQTIENAIQTISQQPISLIGSGRTDAGVHALNQTANFKCETHLTEEIFQKGLNSLLPLDIVIKSCNEVNLNFHARYDVKTKVYEYNIINRDIRPAIFYQYCWFIRKTLDLKAMKSASSYLTGTHNFRAFEGRGSPRKTAIRTILKTSLNKNENHIIFTIEADGFLRYMVRNIVGTLVDAGLGRISPQNFKKILLSRDRSKAGMTAPPQGLFMKKVKY
ncbi:tRNA pseudouridine synthase A [Candidatus Magnetomoraceae bacterium gMMP-1]